MHAYKTLAAGAQQLFPLCHCQACCLCMRNYNTSYPPLPPPCCQVPHQGVRVTGPAGFQFTFLLNCLASTPPFFSSQTPVGLLFSVCLSPSVWLSVSSCTRVVKPCVAFSSTRGGIELCLDGLKQGITPRSFHYALTTHYSKGEGVYYNMSSKDRSIDNLSTVLLTFDDPHQFLLPHCFLCPDCH
jgi:hypothetical protein